MGETKDVAVAGEFSTELLEAIALISGVYGGGVFLPATFAGVEVQDVKRELVQLFEPAHVEVQHLARYTSTPNTGTSLYEGFTFVNRLCPINVKIGATQRWTLVQP